MNTISRYNMMEEEEAVDIAGLVQALIMDGEVFTFTVCVNIYKFSL